MYVHTRVCLPVALLREFLRGGAFQGLRRAVITPSGLRARLAHMRALVRTFFSRFFLLIIVRLLYAYMVAARSLFFRRAVLTAGISLSLSGDFLTAELEFLPIIIESV